MNNKTTIIYRVLFAAAFLLLAAGLFSATRVQSAEISKPGFILKIKNNNLSGDLRSNPLDVNAQSLLLVNTVINDNNGTAVASNWTLSAGSNSVTGSAIPVQVTDLIGTYALSESTVSGYTNTSITCDDNPSVEVTSVTLAEGQTITCTFVNDDDAPSLLLAKTVTNNNGGTTNPSAWTLYADSNSVTGSSTPAEVTNQIGTYDLTESSIAGYTRTSLTCSDNPGIQVTSVSIGLGETITCTFVNDDNAPSLKLAKTVINNNGGTASASAWTLYAGSNSVTGSTTPIQATNQKGTYSLTESTVAGYSRTSLTCSDNPGVQVTSVTIDLGETITCSFVNNDNPPSLRLAKTVINDNGGPAIPSNWTLSAGTNSVTGSATPVEVTNQIGTYALSESPVSGYTLTSLTCDDNPGVQVTEVTLGLGEITTCTFVNNDNAASLLLAKSVINDNFGSALPSDWTLYAGANFVTGSITPVQVTDQIGTYALTESDVLGYGLTSLTCNDLPGVQVTSVTLDLGETITCTFVNNDVGFNITPTSGLITSENGVPTDSFDVVLDTKPSANVTLAITSSDPSEGTVNKSSLTFTPAGPLNIWSIPQTVTVTGVDDSIADGDITFDIITGPVTTTDPDYAALDPVTEIPDVEVTNSDNDIPGLTIAPSTELWVTESGDSLTFNVLLRSQPTAGVSLALASSNTSEGTLNTSSLAFTTANWNAAQSFIVTGVDDCKDNPLGDTFKVSIMATSADINYNGTYEERTLINLDAPTIAWSKPVKTDEIYYYSGFGPIDLEAKSICPEEIQKVEFYYYVDTPFPQWVDIGQDPTAPYRERIEADEITTLWTQVFAFAYGPPNPVVGKQTFSKHERILVLNEIIKLVMLPFVSK